MAILVTGVCYRDIFLDLSVFLLTWSMQDLLVQHLWIGVLGTHSWPDLTIPCDHVTMYHATEWVSSSATPRHSMFYWPKCPAPPSLTVTFTHSCPSFLANLGRKRTAG